MPSFVFSRYIASPPPIQVPADTQYCHKAYYGFDNASVPAQFAQWCAAIGVVGDVEAHLSALLLHARQTYLRPDQTCYWLEMRVTQSNKGHVIPRPHHDGKYWSSELNKADEEIFKVGTCLVGPGTVFWDAHEDNEAAQDIVGRQMMEKVRENGLRTTDKAIDQWAADELDKLAVRMVQPELGEAAKWVVADDKRAGIHSEPDVSDMPHGRILSVN